MWYSINKSYKHKLIKKHEEKITEHNKIKNVNEQSGKCSFLALHNLKDSKHIKL